MKLLSERIAYQASEEGLTVRIKGAGKQEAKRIGYMKAWLIAWYISGFVLASGLFLDYERDVKLFLAVFLAFWGYFSFVITKAYYFKKYGMETLFLNGDQFMMRRDIHGKKGKPQYFRLKHERPFRVLKDKPKLDQFFYSSWWVISGGKVELGEPGAAYRLGQHLNENDALKLVQLLNKHVHLNHL
jgi:hypothetical protein